MMIISSIAVFVLAVACFALVMVNRAKQLNTFMDTLLLQEVDLAGVADGTYTGTADAGIIRVTAQVTVQDHTLTDVALLQHKNGQGKAAESMTGSMIREQKILVDAVSGATLSSRVIQKAVETALAGGGT